MNWHGGCWQLCTSQVREFQLGLNALFRALLSSGENGCRKCSVAWASALRVQGAQTCSVLAAIFNVCPQAIAEAF